MHKPSLLQRRSFSENKLFVSPLIARFKVKLSRRPSTALFLLIMVGVTCGLSFSDLDLTQTFNNPQSAIASSGVSADGNWVWQSPLPAGNNLSGVSCTAPANCLIVGEAGTILQGISGNWVAQHSGVTTNLHGISCPSATECFAVGDNGTILAYNGTAWTPQDSKTTTQLNSVACPSTAVCFAVGNGGVITAYNNGSWSLQDSKTTTQLNTIACPSTNLCFVVGESWLKYDGTGWNVLVAAFSDPANPVTALSCASTSFCVMLYDNGWMQVYDGQNWSPQSINDSRKFNSVTCLSSTLCFAVGGSGQVDHYDGITWVGETTGDTSNNNKTLEAVSCASATYCVTAGLKGEIVVYNGPLAYPDYYHHAWNEVITEPVGLNSLNAVSCPTASDCIAVGDDITQAVYHSGTWNATNGSYQGTGRNYRAISCTSPTNCYAVGSSTYTGDVFFNKYDGNTWSQVHFDSELFYPRNNFTAISCASASYCLALVNDGNGSLGFATYNGNLVWHFQTFSLNGVTSINGLSCTSTSNCWTVGNNGAIINYDGANWTLVTPAITTANLTAISCVDSANCLAVGDNGTVIRYQNASWEALSSATTANLKGIACISADNCGLVGSRGTLIKYNGTGLVGQNSGAANQLNAISCFSASNCTIVGINGNILAKALVVNSNADDDGKGTSVGTLSYALANAAEGQTINLDFSGGTTINITGVMPVVKPGVVINGSCSATGPSVTLNGQGQSGTGFLILDGKNSLFGLKLMNYQGKLLNLKGFGNKLSCSALLK